MDTATFGGGCFWCLEAIFQEVDGVESVISGYAGGTSSNPTYEQVHSGKDEHAEVIQIIFNTNRISYRELVEIFYYIHDPTTPDRQGNDVGKEYRSIILYHDESQRVIANSVTRDFATKLWDKPIATQIFPLTRFWPAEEYHQNFFRNNPELAYCQVVINPKLQKFRSKFESKLKKST